MVLNCLVSANIRLAPSKCQFFRRSVTFLGHICDATGTRPDPRLIEAIDKFQRPKDVKRIERWLGLTGFYRRFIQNYAKIAAPLNELRKKSKAWEWGERQEQSFQVLKGALMQAPVLQRPDFDRPFILTCDYSLDAVGAILSQKDDQGREYVVAYGSKKLTPTEMNYSASEGECFAVITGIRLWRPYLIGRHFTIITDHRALTWLTTNKKFTGRLARWALLLQEFDFTI